MHNATKITVMRTFLLKVFQWWSNIYIYKMISFQMAIPFFCLLWLERTFVWIKMQLIVNNCDCLWDIYRMRAISVSISDEITPSGEKRVKASFGRIWRLKSRTLASRSSSGHQLNHRQSPYTITHLDHCPEGRSRSFNTNDPLPNPRVTLTANLSSECLLWWGE